MKSIYTIAPNFDEWLSNLFSKLADVERGWMDISSSVEVRAIDCRHLNERIKVIAQRSVACVGNGCRRIIRHEYSTRGFEASNRSPVFTGQSSSNGWQPAQEICREIRHRNRSENLSRNLTSAPLSSEI